MQHTGLGFREYVEALEQERSKILVFQRELPLCLDLITQAIETCRQQLSGTTTENNLHGQSESSEQATSNEAPVFEEFIPMKRSSLSDEDEDDDDEQESHKANREKNIDNKRKSDWLRSAGLWNTTTSDPPLKEDVPRKAAVMEVKRNGGAFQPFHREKSVVKPISAEAAAAAAVASMSSSAETETVGSGRREDKDGQNQRKQRRNWSPELHKRFLHALQQLGGPHAATPKQIRELMKVDGLTNDEVKSHLQKFRLHTRRPSPTIHSNGNGNPQAPQYVIWVQPSEYGAVAATTTSGEVANFGATNGIYAPVASPPATAQQRVDQKQSEQSQSEQRVSHSEGSARSNSPATSSSTHNTTTSPMF